MSHRRKRAAPEARIDARRALLAGATGLIGRALLSLLLESPAYATVHVLLRRSVPDLPSHPKLVRLTVDFARLPALPDVDDVFIALGTTIGAAGSRAAFRRVDFDAVRATARAAGAGGARRLLVVSALCADPASRLFYCRVKGEMEREVLALGCETVIIARPSLLAGDREALGQPRRAGEAWALRLLGPVSVWLPERIRPIEAGTVARAMLSAALAAPPGVAILGSDEMQGHRTPS